MKKLLWVIVLAILLGGGTLYYIFALKSYETVDEQVDEITSSEYAIELPLPSDEPVGEEDSETSSTNDDKNNEEINNNETNGQNNDTNENIKGEQKAKSPEHEDSQLTDSDNATKEPPKERSINETQKKENSKPNKPDHTSDTKKKTVTSQMIIQKYRPSFKSLEAQANSKIDQVIDRAFTEYKQKKASGEKISYGYFLQKYKSAGDKLEDKTDQAFLALYSALQNELKKNGLDPAEANVVKEAYEKEKSERRNALLKKALAKLS